MYLAIKRSEKLIQKFIKIKTKSYDRRDKLGYFYENKLLFLNQNDTCMKIHYDNLLSSS